MPMPLQHLRCLIANMMWCHLRTWSANHFALLSLRLSLGTVGLGGLVSVRGVIFRTPNLSLQSVPSIYFQTPSPFLSSSQQQFQQFHIKYSVAFCNVFNNLMFFALPSLLMTHGSVASTPVGRAHFSHMGDYWEQPVYMNKWMPN